MLMCVIGCAGLLAARATYAVEVSSDFVPCMAECFDEHFLCIKCSTEPRSECRHECNEQLAACTPNCRQHMDNFQDPHQ